MPWDQTFVDATVFTFGTFRIRHRQSAAASPPDLGLCTDNGAVGVSSQGVGRTFVRYLNSKHKNAEDNLCGGKKEEEDEEALERLDSEHYFKDQI
ncbi:hypothetical protein F2P81_001522 [Scophthalmus maximus]|uniref:Uncharacterized protein n=1 Tax=Scophthalmus maximus TaxID=52904 RepID=A0A6A4TGB8_SCOMX|nr:hypothetical protein F2P81_001522 [Scophthalmus maximus]